MHKRALLLISHFFFITTSILAQQNLVHVNQVTGTANAVIPLYTLNAAHVSLPISLSYSAKGIGALDVEGSAGMGWNFNAGGSITRDLHGLPDDVQQDMAGNNRHGWIYSQNGIAAMDLSFVNDKDTATYKDAATDIAALNNLGYSDTEPDFFYVNAPGLNCEIVYDDVNYTFKTIPYQDVKIAYTTSTIAGPTLGEITSFTITNDHGIVYNFSTLETTTQKVVSPVSKVEYFQTSYNQYLNGITYTNEWKLTSIQDPYNNVINLTYAPGYKKGYTTPVSLSFAIEEVDWPDGTTQLTQDTVLYKLTGGTTPQLLSNISYSDGVSKSAFALTWQYSSATAKNVITSIQGFGHNFSFTYSTVFGTSNSYGRTFLRSIADGDCTSPFNYTFAYNGETRDSNLGSYTTELPDSVQSVLHIDNWGYLTKNITAGTLTQINYADGGNTALTYEPNNYYASASGTIIGNGIRIKQITHNDGINSAKSITTAYSYLDPVSGTSSGKPLSLPVLSFIRPYRGKGSVSKYWNGTIWIQPGSQADLLRHSTLSSSSDLSSDDHTILYQYVTESRVGAGSTLSQFSIPGTNWDNITTPLPWSPTLINTGSATTASTGFLKNSIDTYPFPPNPNYSFERGLILKTTNYDDNHNEVAESNYTYQPSGTLINITALKYDVNAYGAGYSKYNIYTSTGPVISQVTNKIFDLPSLSAYRQNSTNYVYNTQQKLIQQSTTNSDGSIKTSNTVYAKDYNTTTATDGPTIAIKALQQLNMNIPIEHYTQITPAGSSQAKTVSSELVKFSNSWPVYATNLVLPISRMQFAAPDGAADFVLSANSNGTFVYDPRYYTTENDLGYDSSGNLLSKNNGFKDILTTILDHNFYKTAANFSNTKFDEIAMSDFDSRLVDVNFTLSGGSLTSTNRSGQYGWSLSAGQTLSKTINKNALAQNYVFSIWVNAATAGQFTVSVNGGTVTTTRTASYGITTGNKTGWQYCEVKIPLTGITSTPITITASSSQNVIIDDVLAYPDVATAATYAYDPITRTISAETNTNGVSTYYKYDQLGRLHYTYDQDKNILLRKQYAQGNNVQDISTSFGISGPATASSNLPVTFYVSNTFIPCVVSNVTYTWDFGDGTATVSGDKTTHTYTTNGTYTVSLTANSPVYGIVTKTSTITVASLTQTKIVYTNATMVGTAADKTLARIFSIKFLQGTTVVYTFTEAQLISGAVIVPGSYTINVQTSGPQYSASTGYGYSSVVYQGSSNPQCTSYTSASNIYTFSDNLVNTPTIIFTIQQASCN